MIPRRRLSGGFSLVEVLAATALLGALVTAMLGFMSNLQASRNAALESAASQRAASIFIEHLERDLLACLVGDARNGSGILGGETSVSVLTRAVGLETNSVGDAARMLGDLQRSEYGFDAGARQLTIGRAAAKEVAVASALGGTAARLRLRYHDGAMWRDSFDALAEGHLPQAIEVCVWFTWAGEQPVSREASLEDADDGGDDDTESEGPAPDRRRVIVVPDAGGGS